MATTGQVIAVSAIRPTENASRATLAVHLMIVRKAVPMHSMQPLPATRPPSEESLFTEDGQPTVTTLLILRLMVIGTTHRVIAHELKTSERAVRQQIARIQDHVGAHSDFQLGVMAVTHGWVDPCQKTPTVD